MQTLKTDHTTTVDGLEKEDEIEGTIVISIKEEETALLAAEKIVKKERKLAVKNMLYLGSNISIKRN